MQFQNADSREKKMIFQCYLENLRGVNNWDLVDASAPHIVGGYLYDRDRSLLASLARSDNLWMRRIAVMSTSHFIRNNQFKDSLKIAEVLLHDEHSLIHKAVGWMLREIGKRDQEAAEAFLEQHCNSMPRTMLRYAIERFAAMKRKYWLAR